MQAKLSCYFIYPYSDVHRALVGTLSGLTAFIICYCIHLPKMSAMWLVLFATLVSVATRGETKCQQTAGIAMLAILTAACIPLTVWLHLHTTPVIFWLVMTPVFWCLLIIPRAIPQLAIAVIFLLVYMIIAITVPQIPMTLPQLVILQAIPILAAMLILVLWNTLLPACSLPIPEVDQCSYFYKKNLRLSIAIPISLLLARYFHLQHASWICFTVILVSQANVGATIRRSMQRLGGTFLGVIVGVPVSIYIFGVFAWTHWLAFIILFAVLVSAVRFYYIAIFLATLLIAALYYVMVPGHVGPVAYVLYRLLDTFLGVVLAIILEITVFPNSALRHVRVTHHQFWQQLYVYIDAAMKKKATDSAALDLQDTLQSIQTSTEDMRYEPIGQFTLRFQMVVILFKGYVTLVDYFTDEKMYTTEADVFARQLLPIVKKVENALYTDHAAVYKTLHGVISDLESMCQAMQADKVNPQFITASLHLLQSIKYLQSVVATPRWKFGRV